MEFFIPEEQFNPKPVEVYAEFDRFIVEYSNNLDIYLGAMIPIDWKEIRFNVVEYSFKERYTSY